MSTHLEHGYLITERDPFELVDDLGATLRPVARALFVAKVAQTCAAHVDRERFGLDADDGELTGGQELWRSALSLTRERVTEAHQSARRSEHDLDISVTLLAHPRVPGQMLALLFTGQPDVRTEFEATSGVEPYPYWDHSDRPADVSAEEWAQRRDDWDAALGVEGVPGRRGLTWSPELNPRAYGRGVDVDDVVAALPDVSWRAEHLAAARTPLLPSTKAAIADRPLLEQIGRITDDLPALAAYHRKDADALLPQLAPVTVADLTRTC